MVKALRTRLSGQWAGSREVDYLGQRKLESGNEGSIKNIAGTKYTVVQFHALYLAQGLKV